MKWLSNRLLLWFTPLLLLGNITLTIAQKADSLEALLPQSKGNDLINVHLQLSNTYAERDWEKAIAHANEGLTLAKELRNDSLIFESSLMLSKGYIGLGDTDNALRTAKDALSTALNSSQQASASHHMGRVSEANGEYEKATGFYLQAIELFKSNGNKKSEANALNSLSFVYKEMDQPEKAIALLKEARNIYSSIGNKGRVAGVTFNIGLMTMEMKKPAEAIPYFREAMAGLTEKNEPQKFSYYYNNLASCYEKMLDSNPTFYDSALYYGKKNLVLKKQMKDYRGIANANNVLASIYERARDYTHSYSHSMTALKISDSLNHKKIKENALKYLITAEVGLKKFEKLNDHFEELLDVTEELTKESSSRTLSEMTTKYETVKKEAENQQLLLANAQHARVNLILSLGGIVLLLLLGLLAYFYRGKQKVNSKLQEQKSQIETNLREKEALLREIHHRVKNNLQVISSLLNMQSYYMDDPRMINAITEGQNRVKAMALIHQKLYQTEHLSEIDFQEYTEQLIGHLATALGEPGKLIQSNVNGSALKLDIDTAIPLGLILNELITNSYKYAFSGMKKGNLKVDLTKDDSAYYHLHISDSGKGLPADFNEEKLNSLGLKLVRMLIEQLDGSLTITNEDGAHFYIRFKESKLSA